MKRLPMILLLLLALPTLAAAQNPANFPDVDVCTVRIDNNGDCTADAIDDTVCVTGVVIAWKQFGARGAGAIYDADAGCCISIFDIDLAPDVPIGAIVKVCGWVGSFAGLAEITDNPANGAQDPVVTVLQSSGGEYPCTLIRASDITPQPGKALTPGLNGEILESCCVRICGTFVDTGTFGSGVNYPFVDAFGDTTEVRIDNDTDIVGTTIPTGAVTITGVLGQFDSFTNTCTGYQVIPRSLADFAEGDCTVAVEDKTWGDVKQIYREDD